MNAIIANNEKEIAKVKNNKLSSKTLFHRER